MPMTIESKNQREELFNFEIEESIETTIQHIIRLNTALRDFWGKGGWAPTETAELLSRSRLDWQVSLSHSLKTWLTPVEPEANDGRLILAWVNLGSLVEGSMKLFLAIFYHDYSKDPELLKSKVLSPDDFMLERLRQFFDKRQLWMDNGPRSEWVQGILQKRNAIHSFKHREIGSFDDFFSNVRTYLRFLRNINGRLPYPDGEQRPYLLMD